MWYLLTRCHVPEEPEILNMDWLRPPHHKDAPTEDYDNANRAHHKDAPEEDCDDANNHKGVHSEDCDDANGAIDVPNEDNDDANCLSRCEQNCVGRHSGRSPGRWIVSRGWMQRFLPQSQSSELFTPGRADARLST